MRGWASDAFGRFITWCGSVWFRFVLIRFDVEMCARSPNQSSRLQCGRWMNGDWDCRNDDGLAALMDWKCGNALRSFDSDIWPHEKLRAMLPMFRGTECMSDTVNGGSWQRLTTWGAFKVEAIWASSNSSRRSGVHRRCIASHNAIIIYSKGNRRFLTPPLFILNRILTPLPFIPTAHTKPGFPSHNQNVNEGLRDELVSIPFGYVPYGRKIEYNAR